jgi:hypothetical protein
MKRSLLMVVLIGLMSVGAMAQKDVGQMFKAGLEDGETLSKAYLQPYGEMLGSALNAGWYTSAAPHHLLGFEITLMGSYIMVPNAGKSFDIQKLGLKEFEVADGSGSISPTMSGKMASADLPELVSTSDPSSTRISMPNGTGLDYMISPMLQAAVGLPFNTEVMVRFVPERNWGDYGTAGLWGLGFKHSLKDYVPFLKRVPFWNMALLGAYTNFDSNLKLPDVDEAIYNGRLGIKSSAYTARLLVGANFPIISFFAGMGYGNANSDFNVSGDFYETEINQVGFGYVTDGFDFNIGTRLRFGIIALSADYSTGDYNMYNVGIGINFR